MYLTIQAIVLRVTDYNDRDALLTVLTRNHGKLTIKARGLRRKNSPLIAPCQLLAFGEFTLFEYRGMYTVNEAHSIELFQHLRRDLTKLSLGTYFAQVAEVISQEDLPNPELQSLVLNCLYALANDLCDPVAVKAAFELRYMAQRGYEPDLYSCSGCGEVLESGRAIPERGEVYCKNCAAPFGIDLSANALSAARHILTCELKKLLSVSVSPDEARALSDFSGRYLRSCLERGFKTLDFYNSLGDIR